LQAIQATRSPGRPRVFEAKRVDVGDLGQPRGRIELEPSKDLVGQDVDLALGRERDESVEGPSVRHCAGRVVREIDVDDPGVRPQRRAQPVEVETPIVVGAEGDSGRHARRQRNVFGGLIGGGHDHGMVAGFHERVEGREDRFLPAGEAEHVVGGDHSVGRGDRGTELQCPARLAVAERHPLEILALFLLGHRAQVRQEHRLGRRGGQIVPALELPPRLDQGGAQFTELQHGAPSIDRSRAPP
jgi:hypothetical protein